MAKPINAKDRLIRNMFLGCLGFGMAIGLALGSGILPAANQWSATAAILTSVIGSIALLGGTIWFLGKTDEHDRNAHLWSMTWAWLFIAVASPSWWLLNKAGVIDAPADAIIILFASSFVGTAAWLWARYR